MAKRKSKSSAKKTPAPKTEKTSEPREMNRVRLGGKQAQVLLAMAKGARLVVRHTEGQKRQRVEWDKNTYSGKLPIAPIINAIVIYVERGWLRHSSPKTKDGVTTTVYALAPDGRAALKTHASSAKSGGSTSDKTGGKAAKAKAKVKAKKKKKTD